MTDILINILIITTATFFAIKISNFIFQQALKKNNRIHIQFMKDVVRTFFIIIGIVVVGMQFTITKEISSVLLKNTALLVAILGFAAQQTLNDILSGFMLSQSKPFDIGERIHLVNKNITGTIEDLTLRHTVIRCFDNTRVIIPNSVINKEILKNSNHEDSIIGNYLEINIASNHDVHYVMELIQDIIIAHPSVITTDIYVPGILVKNIDKHGFYLKATVWTKTVDENFEACSDIRIAIQESFTEKGIEFL